MKIDVNLDKLFDLEPQPPAVPGQPLVSLLPSEQTNDEEKNDDYQLARSTLRDLIGKNGAVISNMVDLAGRSEHPRAFEVAGQLIKAQSEIAKDLLGLHKQKKDIEGKESSKSIKTQNNIVFAGSTSDLMKMINGDKTKIINAE